jgi:hypothetical protein
MQAMTVSEKDLHRVFFCKVRPGHWRKMPTEEE